MTMNRRYLALGTMLSAALVAGCTAAPVATAPEPSALGTETQAAALDGSEGPAHYRMMASIVPVAYTTATVNNHIAARANDNSFSTYWQSGAFNKPVYRAVLGARAQIAALRLKLNPNVGTYTIETSEDARTWKVALTGQKNTTWYPETKTLPANTWGKYVRLTFANNGWNVNMYELDVYSGSGTTTPTTAPTTAPTAAPTTAPTAAPTPTPAPVATPAPTTGTTDPMVKQVFDLVNAERAKVGAKALVLSDAINKCAQFRSQDMATRNYFSHTDPDGHDPFYWLKQYGISYRTAGENIAMGQTSAASVMSGWMNSSGHKANILNTSYGKIGIGVAKNSAGRLYWTQLFTD
jgi:uncharacterized protein YkwD